MTEHVIVLAGGRGVRAGGPKALHVVNGRAWWEIQRERLECVGLPVTWVVSERVLAGMRAGGSRLPERVALADEMAPMFASVKAGIARVAADGGARGVFVLPVDVPAAGAPVFTMLGAREGAAIPTHKGEHGHPVYIAWSVVERRVIPASDGDRLDRLIEDVRAEVPVTDASVAINLNTAEEFTDWANSHA
jgi:CTP:molybdopterin cytidylyltransferase MocA